MSDFRSSAHATVLVCTTCRTLASLGSVQSAADAPCAGVALAEATALAAAGRPGISVQGIRCLGNCGRGLSAAIRCQRAWTYVFGGLEAPRDGHTLIAGAQLLAQAADGIMPWRGRPEPLKRGLVARLPPDNDCGDAP